jgi:hypothetical protein
MSPVFWVATTLVAFKYFASRASGGRLYGLHSLIVSSRSVTTTVNSLEPFGELKTECTLLQTVPNSIQW